jgi:magnesium-transporting ATPase (P-type)
VSLCHDVIATKKNGSSSLSYQGTSPDEITLLDAAKEVGYTFLDRNSDTIFLNILGRNQQYKLLQKLEFTADRKKMSVIVQDQ